MAWSPRNMPNMHTRSKSFKYTCGCIIAAKGTNAPVTPVTPVTPGGDHYCGKVGTSRRMGVDGCLQRRKLSSGITGLARDGVLRRRIFRGWTPNNPLQGPTLP